MKISTILSLLPFQTRPSTSGGKVLDEVTVLGLKVQQPHGTRLHCNWINVDEVLPFLKGGVPKHPVKQKHSISNLKTQPFRYSI